MYETKKSKIVIFKTSFILMLKMERFDALIQSRQLMRKPFQRRGVEWCVNNEYGTHGPLPGHKRPIRGGIVADEMGLGKTITLIGTMIVNPLPYTLLVLPVALINQWVNEINKNIGKITFVYHGAKSKKISFKDDVFECVNKMSQVVVITTYATLARISLYDNNPLTGINWNRIIFDEAHHLRNKKTKQHIMALKLHSNIRWMISGTPFQNNMRDLYNMYCIIGLAKQYTKSSTNFSTIFRHFFMRRTKAETTDTILPDIYSNRNIIKWGNDKKAALNAHTQTYAIITQSSVASENKKKRVNHKQNNNNQSNCGKQSRMCMITHIMRARQSCVLPITNNSTTSSKIDGVIQQLVSRKSNGNGKIVFCVFRKEIDLIAAKLIENGIKNVVTYDGRKTHKERAKILKNDINILIMQIQVGCEGLNLQDKFSEVYFVSPTWNPSIEEQAIARCHRTGQKKPVYIFKFYMDGFKQNFNSMDYEMCILQEKKKLIVENILAHQ